jgi:membrane dipeptidase
MSPGVSAERGPWIDLHSHAGRSLADFADEVIRLTEAAGPAGVAIGTDLDGNYRPVLTGYAQLTDLTALLRDRGLTEHHVKQVLGGNAASLLRRTIH